MENMENKPMNKRNWFLIVLFGLVGQLCWAVENSTFAAYALELTGDSGVITLMTSFSGAFTVFASFIGGTCSDRLGKRQKIITIGMLLWGIFTILFGFADFIPKDAKNMAFIAFYVVSMDSIMSFWGSFGFTGGFQPWTTDVSNKTNRGTVATIVSACSIVANIIIQGLQGTIVELTGSFMPIFAFVGGVVLICGIVAIFLIKDDKDLQPSKTHPKFWGQFAQQFNFKEIFKIKDMLLLLLTLSIYTCGFNVYMSYATNYLWYGFPDYAGIELSKGNGSIIMGIGMLAATGLSFLFVKPTNKGKAPLVTLVSIIISIGGCIWLNFAKSVVTVTIALIIACLGYMVNLSALNAWFKNISPENERGGYEGVRQIFYNLFPMIIGPLVAQIIIKNLSYTKEINGVNVEIPSHYLFLAAAAIMLFSFIPLVISMVRAKKDQSIEAK